MARPVWFALGWVFVALGSIGVVVPGLPTTGFFVLAASCFAKSSPRFERWVLGLPGVGPMVRDYRAGLGMPRQAKAWAIGMIVAVSLLSAVFAVDNRAVGAVIVAVALVGVWYVGWRIPTRERVLEAGGEATS
jgi:uncharacterized membrane protein YbaN (DUF454 family)